MCGIHTIAVVKCTEKSIGGYVMSLKSIMNRNVAVCTEDMPLEQVYNLMREGSFDHVCVVENHAHQKPIGLITERDICFQILGKGRNPRGLTAANVMNTRIIKADAGLSISECTELIANCSTKTLCIVDNNGVLCGTINRNELKSINATESAGFVSRHTFFPDYNVAMDRLF